MFNIIEECPIESLLIREQYFMDTLIFAQDYINKVNSKFDELAFNIVCLANTTIVSKETREKITNTLKNLREQGLIAKTNTKKCFQYNRFTGDLIKV